MMGSKAAAGFGMAGRYDNREEFVARLQPIIDKQVEIYREKPRRTDRRG